MNVKIDNTEVQVVWESNEAVVALEKKAVSGPIVVNMSRYGGFEQVGPLGVKLPRNDEQITTNAGDIMLYAGDQIVVFYGSNSWAYTRLGKIIGLTQIELEQLLAAKDVTLTFTLAE